MRAFNLEEAMAGKSVCTREGCNARIICFDAKRVDPIIALVEYGGEEYCYCYTNEGSFDIGKISDYDLMMKE